MALRRPRLKEGGLPVVRGTGICAGICPPRAASGRAALRITRTLSFAKAKGVTRMELSREAGEDDWVSSALFTALRKAWVAEGTGGFRRSSPSFLTASGEDFGGGFTSRGRWQTIPAVTPPLGSFLLRLIQV